MEGTPQQTISTRSGAWLIGAGLVYLAVPNLLFLAGWYTPPVAVAAAVVLVFYVSRAVWLLAQNSSKETPLGWRGVAAVALLFLCLVFFFLRDGIVGVTETHGDYYMFRQALFCNVRDAAWPVVLPSGKEMSYYLAGILPPALLARILPAACCQWCIVAWSVLPIGLALLILAEGVPGTSRRWPALLAVSLGVLLIRDPFFVLFQTHIGCYIRDIATLFGVDLHNFFCQNTGVLNPIQECTGAYNSVPPTLLAAAIMAKGGWANRFLVPLVYALLLPSAPIACIGLLPVALWLYGQAWAAAGRSWRQMAVEAPLPAVMLLLGGIYFLRGENGIFFSLTGCHWGWPRALAGYVRVLLAWLLLVLPLAKAEKGKGLYIAMASFLLVAHAFILGSSQSEYNELWLKSTPAYLMLLGWLWVKDWAALPKWKYAVAGLCLLGTLHAVAKPWFHADFSRYGLVSDAWNGHLNHDHPFLNQSVPPTREPLLPGILLRHAGESEKHFPGALLPSAPGCDYTRPQNHSASTP